MPFQPMIPIKGPNGQWFQPVVSTPNQVSTTNPVLLPIATAEDKAAADATSAHALAQAAMSAHSGYEPALAAIKTAVSSWRVVQKLAQAIIDGPGDGSTEMTEAKAAAPGIVTTAVGALHDMGSLYQALSLDQAHKRPDLPPAAVMPDSSGGPSWWPLAIAGTVGLLLWKLVTR